MARPRKKAEPVEGPITTVRVLWPNVGTSRGKCFKGEEVELPTEEAKYLDGLDAIKIVRGADDAA